MNRRGFFSNLFNRRREGDPLFFGIQCVINVYGEDTLRAQLYNVINQQMPTESPGEKFMFYKRITAVLRENIHFFEYGHWDYITDADDATAEFDDWAWKPIDELPKLIVPFKRKLYEEVVATFRHLAG